MKPAPTTPTFLRLLAGTSLGRRAPLLSSPMETNSVRIIAAASLERRILANQRDSTFSARSIGSCKPWYTASRIA
jgi:hypothetical protein